MAYNYGMKKKTVLKLCAAVILAVLTIALAVCLVFNKWIITIDINGSSEMNVEYDSKYEDAGARARVEGSILSFFNRELDVNTSGSVNTKELGDYTITYSADWKKVHEEKTRTVHVKDMTAPVITLVTNPDSYTLPNHPYEEEGYTAMDNRDGDVTDRVVSEEQNGTVYYSVTDSAGNTAKVERKIVYDDRTAPVLTLTGGEEMTWYTGTAYSDSYSAVDDADGDITDKVVVTGSVDGYSVGDYTLHYSVSDTWGNVTEADRVVHVKVKPVNRPAASEDDHTIYLTFDDGPYQYTEQLLNTLDQYNVKATFFTTSAYPQYAWLIGEEARRGHTVCVHTASHNYSSIYSSDEAYWSDFNKQNQVIYEQTGSYADMFRFPGGSSNTVSANYSSGIMTRLAQQAEGRGLYYYDWNVSSGDAGDTTSGDVVFENVTSQVAANTKYGKCSVVLQHDTKGFSVETVSRIIEWGLENGYHFEALTEGSFKAHHGINN